MTETTTGPATLARHPLARAAGIALCGALACAAPPALAQTPAQASPSDATAARPYDIPAGPLAPALRSLASTANVLLTFTAEQTDGRHTAGLQGTHRFTAALDALLAGTGLQAVALRDGGYVLRALPTALVQATPATGGEAALPVVRVLASQERESPTGPLQGYAATRSATGTRTDTPIIETPQSITVIGAEEMETRKAQSLQDALGYVAGLNRAEGQDRTTDAFFLRGFRTSNSSVFRDGRMYIVNYYNGQQEPYGLERIEVLKGAASVLYGAAAPGGLINTVSKRPTTERLRELHAEAGSFGRKQVAGDFAGAIDAQGEWSYRLTFLKRDSHSFNDYVPDDRLYIAPALKWQPDAATSLTLLTEYQQDRTVYVDGLPAAGTLAPNPNGRIPRTRFTGEPGYDGFRLKRYSIGYLFEHAFSEQWKLNHSLRYYHAQNDYRNTWGWGLSDDLRSTADRGAQDRWDRSSSAVIDTSVQYRTTTGSVEHTALVGFDYSAPRHESERYDRTAANLDYYAPVYGRPMGPATPAAFAWKSDMQRLGIYAQQQMKIAGKWVVMLGGRQDRVRYDERNFFTGEKNVDNEKSQAFSGRAGLVYLADNGLAPFLSYSESFEPTDGRDRLGNRFKPTRGAQYEAGVRYQPEGSGTLLSAVVYQLTQDNVSVPDPASASFSVQAGQVRSRGFELEARTGLGRHGRLIAAYAYTDARTTRASPLQPQEQGRRSLSTPLHQLSLWGDYALDAWGAPGVRLGAGWRYLGETFGLAQGTRVTLPSYGLIDAMVSYRTGPWRFALNVSNLADRNYIASCTYGCFYGEPRRATVSATYRW